MLLFVKKLMAIISDMTVSVGVWFDCIVADEMHVSVLCSEREPG